MSRALLPLAWLPLLGCLSEPAFEFDNPCDPLQGGDCGALIGDAAPRPLDVAPLDAGPVDAAPRDQGWAVEIGPALDAAPRPDAYAPMPTLAADTDGDGWPDDVDDCPLADLTDSEGARVDLCQEGDGADPLSPCAADCVHAPTAFEPRLLFMGAATGAVEGWALSEAGAAWGDEAFAPLDGPVIDAAITSTLRAFLTPDWLFIQAQGGLRPYALRPARLDAPLRRVIPGDAGGPWLLDEADQRWRRQDGAWRNQEGITAMAQREGAIWIADAVGLRREVEGSPPEPLALPELPTLAPIREIKPLGDAALLLIGRGLGRVALSAPLSLEIRAYGEALRDGAALEDGAWVGLTQGGALIALEAGGEAAPLEPAWPIEEATAPPQIRALRAQGAALELLTASGRYRLDAQGALTRAALPMIDATAAQVTPLGGFEGLVMALQRGQGYALSRLNASGDFEALPTPADETPEGEAPEVDLGAPMECFASTRAPVGTLCVFERGLAWLEAGVWRVPPQRMAGRFTRLVEAAGMYYLIGDGVIGRARPPASAEGNWEISQARGQAGVRCAAWTPWGALWLGGVGGLFVLNDEDNDSIDPVPLGLDTQAPSINAIQFDPLGTAWLGTDHGLYRRDPDGLTRPYGIAGLARHPVHDLRWVAGLGLVIADEAGVAVLDGARLKRVGYAHGLPGRAALRLIEAADGLWVRGERGVARLDPAAL
ncbi:hypothetical protein KKF91_14455 [Myxococcota bacterium]|nr:hypothetical protein [Myxococcota bacterium]